MAFSEPINKKAVAYYRHSAKDKQENSVAIQQGHTQSFAKAHNIEIIHEEADEGESGLSAARPGYQRLFDDWITNPNAPTFDFVFVYDVSRWGRFQDQDEAAHYEYTCKKHGKKVVYVSQGFPKEDEQLISTLQTSIGRYMAAEYSRQLSGKVFHGCVKVSEQGFSAGGQPPYGMSRLLLNEDKKPIKLLKRGQWKSISNERVTFAPAGDETSEVVKEMFSLLVEKWESPQTIAEILNKRKIVTTQGKKWKSIGVLHILTNEIYTGTRIYNKTWGRLKQKHRKNPRSEWVIQPNAFEGIISSELFNAAQDRLYWLMPSKWQKGVYVVRKARRDLQAEITNLLTSKGMEIDDADMAVRKLPMAIGARFTVDGVSNWCFTVKEYMKNYDYILGVSVAIDRHDPVDRFFWIPISTFDGTDFVVFSEKDDCYHTSSIPSGEVQKRILSLLPSFQPASGAPSAEEVTE
jgi:DNA invertase Pin-like site-specific DNA recombinase